MPSYHTTVLSTHAVLTLRACTMLPCYHRLALPDVDSREGRLTMGMNMNGVLVRQSHTHYKSKWLLVTTPP